MNNTKQNYTRIFFMYFAASFLIGIPYALINGIWPKTIIGWIIVVIFALPTIIVGEFLGEKLFSDKISQTIDKDKQDNLFSIRRMAYALIIGIVTIAVVVSVGFLLRAKIGAHISVQ